MLIETADISCGGHDQDIRIQAQDFRILPESRFQDGRFPQRFP